MEITRPKEENYIHRTVFSGWDVYRSEFPLLAIIRPDIVNDEVNSLLKIAEVNNSSFPRWELLGINAGCMVGDPGLIVVADAYLKNIRNFDTQKAYRIGVASGRGEKELFNKEFHTIRPLAEEYLNKSYVPEKLSDTLEYLLADYTMYLFCKEKGDSENAEFFFNRVKSYKDNYNEKLGFLAPRYKSGEFVFEENEYDDDGCVESNIFQQSWFVPYDVPGLFNLFGNERAHVLLERFFEKADLSKLWNDDYNHSNEPCHNLTIILILQALHIVHSTGQEKYKRKLTERVLSASAVTRMSVSFQRGTFFQLWALLRFARVIRIILLIRLYSERLPLN